jgi:hypothetical protein
VLSQVGFQLAATPTRALASVLLQRARLRLRGLRWRERAEGELDAEQALKIETCWAVGIGLGIVDNIRAADFQTRNLSSRCKPASRGASRALSRSRRSSSPPAAHGARSDRLGSAPRRPGWPSSTAPHLLGLSHMATGVSAFLEGRYHAAQEACARAERIFLERCSGVAWEIGATRSFLLWSTFFLGRLGELDRRVPLLVEEAERRGDVYSLTILDTEFQHLRDAAADRPQAGRESIAGAMRRWTHDGFHLEHFWALHAEAQLDLYDGHPERVLETLERTWPDLDRALILRIQQARIECHSLRARAALAAAWKNDGDARAALVRRALADTQRMERERAPWAEAIALLYRASAAACLGDAARARGYLDDAITRCEAQALRLHAEAGRMRRSALGGEGAAEDARAPRPTCVERAWCDRSG